jgi:hypothetical protein
LLRVAAAAVVEMPVVAALAGCLQAHLPQLPAQSTPQRLVQVVLVGHQAHKQVEALALIPQSQAKHQPLVGAKAVMAQVALAGQAAVAAIPHLPQAAQGHRVRAALVVQHLQQLLVVLAAVVAQVLLAVPVLGKQVALAGLGQPHQ